MTWLTEDPTPVLILGGLVLLLLTVLLWRSGRAIYFLGMFVTVLIMGGAMLIDYLVVTDRERIQDVLTAAAAAVEANDLPRVKTYLSPTATEVHAKVEQALRSGHFQKVRINGSPIIKINHLRSPPDAVAEFSVVVQGKLRGADQIRDTAIQKVRVQLREETEGHWLIYHAEDGSTEVEDFGAGSDK